MLSFHHHVVPKYATTVEKRIRVACHVGHSHKAGPYVRREGASNYKQITQRRNVLTRRRVAFISVQRTPLWMLVRRLVEIPQLTDNH
nr:unnamed protein product [Spirometra erinaceieuropaei]